jgi:hypothetical protein
MNSKLLIVAISFLTLPAFAAPSSSTSLKKQKRTTASVAVADSTATSSMTVPSSSSSNQPNFEPKGLRVSLFKPVLTARTQTTGQGNTEMSFDNTFGLSIGYANLPLKQIGWTANASYIEIFYAGDKLGVLRTDANVAYGFTKNLNIKGGLNLSKFVIPERVRDEYNPSVGFQSSLGLQVTKNVGVDAGYTFMKQTNKRQDIELAGLELGVNATF